MSDYNKKSNSTLLIVVLLIAAVAGLAYYFLSGKTTQPTANVDSAVQEQVTEETVTPETTPSEEALTDTTTAPIVKDETPASPEVVVETKTLNLPAAKTPDIPTATASTDPAVEKMMGLRKLGSDEAPIKVVEYASLTCGHCASFHNDEFKKIKTDYIDTGKVQFIFKEFPLNKPAVDASKLLRCMPDDKFMPFQSILFEQQDKWAYNPDYLPILKQNAKLAGLGDKDIDACLGNKELENRLIGDMKAATDKYQINSTPTFIINDGVKTLVGHQPFDVFKETFDGILTKAAQSVPNAAETKN